MKRLISMIVCFILLATGTYAVAETTDTVFDNSQFEGLPGYTYSKMDKQYRYEAEYVEEFTATGIKGYSNVFVKMTFYVEGRKNGAGFIKMSFTSYDKTKAKFDKVDAVSILVDDTLYSFDDMDIIDDGYSFVALGNIGIDMIKALQDAKEIVIRYEFDNYYYRDLEPRIVDVNSIITWAKKVVSSGIIAMMNRTYLDFCDTYYKATKE